MHSFIVITVEAGPYVLLGGGGRAAGGAQHPRAELGKGATAHQARTCHAAMASPTPGRPQLLIPLSLFPSFSGEREPWATTEMGTPNPPDGSS